MKSNATGEIMMNLKADLSAQVSMSWLPTRQASTKRVIFAKVGNVRPIITARVIN